MVQVLELQTAYTMSHPTTLILIFVMENKVHNTSEPLSQCISKFLVCATFFQTEILHENPPIYKLAILGGDIYI